MKWKIKHLTHLRSSVGLLHMVGRSICLKINWVIRNASCSIWRKIWDLMLYQIEVRISHWIPNKKVRHHSTLATETSNKLYPSNMTFKLSNRKLVRLVTQTTNLFLEMTCFRKIRLIVWFQDWMKLKLIQLKSGVLNLEIEEMEIHTELYIEKNIIIFR